MRVLSFLLALTIAPLAMAQDDGQPPVIVEMPSVKQWIEAPFPPEAEAAGVLVGRVVVRVSIDQAGLVVGAEVRSSDPPDLGFEAEALDAVSRMRFNPALGEEGPVPATFDFAYNFELAVATDGIAAPAQVNLDGIVRELGTRAPIGSALVTLEWAGQGEAPPAPPQLATQPDGSFEFSGVPPGLWKLLVSGPIHLKFAESIEITEGEATNIAAWLRVDSTSANEITVFGERDRPPEITRRTLTSKEIRRIPGTFGDPVKVIQTLPGAARSPFGTGLLIIRGANPEDSGVYVDGIRVPLIYHLTGTTSVIAPDFVDSVDYLPGGYAAKFGRTSAGTIDVQTIRTIDETKISAGADILDAQAYVQTNIPLNKDGDKKLGVAIGARRSYIDVFLPLFLDGSAFSIKPRYYDYQVKLLAPTPEHRRLSLFVYGFDDTLEISTPADRAQGPDADTQGNIATKYNSHRFIARWDEKLSPTVNFRLIPSLGIDQTLFAIGDALTFDGRSTNFQLRSALEWSPSDAVTVTPGLDLLSGPWSFKFQAPLRIDDLDNPIGEREPIGLSGGGWATYPDTWLRLDLKPLDDRDRLLLTPSVRLNGLALTYDGQAAGADPKPFTRNAVDPRFSGRFELFDGFAIKGSSGFYHQPPQPQESVSIGVAPELSYERAWNSSFGLEHQLSQSIEYEIEGFYRDMTQLIDNNPDFGGLGEQPFANVGYGRAYGLEVIARHQPTGRFFGWVSYTLSRSERKRSIDSDWTAFDFDQTHIFSAQAGYDLPLDFGLSFQVQYVTGNPDTPLNAGVYDSDDGSYNGFRVGAVNGERLPDFFQTSLRIDKTFVYKSWELGAYLDLLNVVKGVNPEFTIYSFDYADAAYVRGLPFIPNLGIEARIRR